MERYRQFDRLVINDFTTDTWEHPLHNHNHFEIIYIAKGKGIHHLNSRKIPYQKGHLYLLGPDDEHEFIVEERSRFIYYKFTSLYLDTTDVDSPSNWNRDVDALLQSNECKTGNILKLEGDKELVERLLNIIVDEYHRDELLSKKIIFQFFKALVLILKRNQQYTGEKASRNRSSGISGELMEYLDLNIYHPKRLTQKAIAEHFHLSPNYVGSYFKEKVGTPLKQYIQEYRYSLLEQRIKNGQTSTKQLAADFGFTDESHLHKFVKSQSGKNLTEMRDGLLA